LAQITDADLQAFLADQIKRQNNG